MKKLVLVVLIATMLASCKKEYINTYTMVDCNFSIASGLNIAVDSLYSKMASSKIDYSKYKVKVTTPDKYYIYFIAESQVIHKFSNMEVGSHTLKVQDRVYDNVIVTNYNLDNTDALYSYNNDAEYKSKMLYSIPSTSDSLIILNNITNLDPNQNNTITLYNPYALVVGFNVESMATSEDVPFIAKTDKGIDFCYLFIKDRNTSTIDNSWDINVKYIVNEKLFNSSAIGVKNNKVTKLIADENVAPDTETGFTIKTDDLYKEQEDHILPAL
jgi:hypothetical protein